MVFRLHSYSGRENGLMIIGCSSDLRQLAEQIQLAIRDKEEIETLDWPRHVTGIEVKDKTVANGPYMVSFHIETIKGEPKPTFRANVRAWVSFFVFALALTGLISIGNLLLSHL